LVNRKLILAHFWLAFAVFGLALVLGAWQMFIRSPLHTWLTNPEWYYRSLTAHGTVMGYVFPTLVAMGFGYAITESALEQRLVGVRWAWAGFWLVVIGAIMAMVPVALGRASVLLPSIRRSSAARSTTSAWSSSWSAPGSGSR
jgi:cytochrome c oxidase subunit 1